MIRKQLWKRAYARSYPSLQLVKFDGVFVINKGACYSSETNQPQKSVVWSERAGNFNKDFVIQETVKLVKRFHNLKT